MTPVLPLGTTVPEAIEDQRLLLSSFLTERGIDSFLTWYYTPMALEFTSQLKPELVIYDCMDELSAFYAAPPAAGRVGAELFLVPMWSLWAVEASIQAKSRAACERLFVSRAASMRPFRAARKPNRPIPSDQRRISHPRSDFLACSMNASTLICSPASQKPSRLASGHLGPMAKISPDNLRQLPTSTISAKDICGTSHLFSHWDIALIPFAITPTRFISPTKTPEYLAAGKRVVSTAIPDVVAPYRGLGLVQIADTVEDLVSAIQMALAEDPEERLQTC